MIVRQLIWCWSRVPRMKYLCCSPRKGRRSQRGVSMHTIYGAILSLGISWGVAKPRNRIRCRHYPWPPVARPLGRGHWGLPSCCSHSSAVPGCFVTAANIEYVARDDPSQIASQKTSFTKNKWSIKHGKQHVIENHAYSYFELALWIKSFEIDPLLALSEWQRWPRSSHLKLMGNQ